MTKTPDPLPTFLQMHLDRIEEIARHSDDIEAHEAPCFLEELTAAIIRLSRREQTRHLARHLAKRLIDAIRD